MLNLFHAECYKLWRNKSFYICALTGALISLLLYGTLFLVDNLERTDSQQGQEGFSVTATVNEEAGDLGSTELQGKEEAIPMSQRIGIMGVIEQMLSGSFAGFITTIFVCIFVVGEYGNGAIKNVVSKGYSRGTVFLSKLLAAELAALLLNLAIIGACLLFGAILMGKSGIEAIAWKDLAIFTGIQMAFSAALTGIVAMIGEITRSLGSGIALSLGLLMFSTSITAGLDLLFHDLHWKPSSYWLLDLQTTALADVLQKDFLIRAAALSIFWLLAAAAAGMLHFKKADIK